MSLVKILRVETSSGRGMYDDLWFQCGLPCDEKHPCVVSDSRYQEDLKAKFGDGRSWEPAGHRFGFLDSNMMRRWIYNDEWFIKMSLKGGVICTYEVPVDHLVIGRTQVTFDFEKATCLERKPLASVLEQD